MENNTDLLDCLITSLAETLKDYAEKKMPIKQRIDQLQKAGFTVEQRPHKGMYTGSIYTTKRAAYASQKIESRVSIHAPRGRYALCVII